MIGIIPAAGYARRVQPLPCSKEVYPVRGRPVMDYLLERLSLAQCSEVRVVVRREKGDVIANARRHGATVVEANPESVSASLLAGMRGLSRDDLVLFGFPDTIWEPKDGFCRIRKKVSARYDVALGLFRTPDLERSDVVTLSETSVIEAIHVKPSRPASNWIWGCAAARAHILSGLEAYSEPGAYFDVLSKHERVIGIKLSDSWIDIGTPSALAQISR